MDEQMTAGTQQALDLPRGFHHDGVYQLEAGISDDVMSGLERLGHVVARPHEPHGGGQAIWIDWERDVLIGGSDPRYLSILPSRLFDAAHEALRLHDRTEGRLGSGAGAAECISSFSGRTGTAPCREWRGVACWKKTTFPRPTQLLAAIAGRSVASVSPEAARSKMQAAIDAAAKGDFGLSVADIKRIARKLPRDHSAVIVLFENAWERRLKEVAARHGGAISAQRMITPDALVATVSKIATGGKRARTRRAARPLA